MKIQEPELKIKNRPGRGPLQPKPISSFIVHRSAFLLDELRFLQRSLSAYPLFALIFGALALFTLAYQAPLDFAFKLGPANNADYLYAASFNPPEPNPDLSFRWSSAESYLRFPGVGRLPQATLEVTMQVGGRPASLPPPIVEVWADGRKLKEVTVGPGAQVYSFGYRAEGPGRQLKGDLIFTLKTPDAFQDKNHNLPLGVVVTEARLKGGPADNRPVWPALPHTALLLTGLAIFYLALVRSGWTPLAAARWAGLLAVALAIALAFYRLHLTPATEELFLAMALAYPLTALGVSTMRFWIYPHTGAGDLRFTIKKEAKIQNYLPPTEQESQIQNPKSKIQNNLAWLGLIFFTVFVVKAAGLNHPAFTTIDHWFRVHQILRFWDNPADFWQQYYNVSTGKTVTGLGGGSAVLGQWGVSVSLPYSPLFYLLAAPLARIWPTHDPNLLAAVNLLASWLEASSIFLVYLIARQAYRGAWAGRAGVIAAALYGFYPLSYLLFSDGGYNSILAHWLTLLFIAMLFKYFQPQPTKAGSSLKTVVATSENPTNHYPSSTIHHPPSTIHSILLALVLALALLAHTSTLLLLGSLVIVAAIFYAGANGRKSLPFVFIVLGGFGLAFALYYGWYLIPFVQNSLPALLGKLGNGSIGQDNKLLGTDLLSGFWPQLWAHFRLFPFLLTLLYFGFAIWDLLPQGMRPRFSNGDKAKAAKLLSPKSGIVRPVLWAWLVVFLAFSLVDLKVNLLQKHMLFAAPLLCLGSGFALSLLWELATNKANSNQSQSSQNSSFLFPLSSFLLPLSSFLLVAFLIWQGLVVWYSRVYYYILPPGSG